MSDDVVCKMDPRRRQLLAATSVAASAVGAATLVPLVASMSPSARAKAAGAPVQVDVKGLAPGQMITPEWRGQPIFVVRRTQEMIDALNSPALLQRLADPQSKNEDQQPKYCQNATRSIRPDLMVAKGICTHLGCSPTPILTMGAASTLGADWPGGYHCPCHGSFFDLAGRVFKNVPAPANLIIPPHNLTEAGVLTIGVGKDGKEA